MKAKIKMVELRTVALALLRGWITGAEDGAIFIPANRCLNSQRIAFTSTPRGECTKCCKSMDEMRATYVELPCQNGRYTMNNIASAKTALQKKLHMARSILRSPRTLNQINIGVNRMPTRLTLIASPSNAIAPTSYLPPFCCA